MKILIDIGHPAHVHLFKNFAWQTIKNGNEVFFTCREKEFEKYLLEKYGFNYKSFGKKFNSTAGKVWGLIKFDLKEFLEGLKFKPDIFLSHGSMYAAHAAFFLGKPHISLEDTGNREQVNLYNPFTSVILTSDFFPINYGNKQIRYKGYHELAYLNPKYFNQSAHLQINKPYAIIRFVSWKASHDFNHRGLSVYDKLKLVEILHKYKNVFISSESELPQELVPFINTFAPDQIHNVLFNADIFIGEGTTMAVEAAILGTPSIYINPLQYSNVSDLINYNLIYSFSDFNGVEEKINLLLNRKNLKEEWQKRRKKMLADKIDVTAFLVWFVENYPESFRIMKINPDYQYNFK